MAAFSGKSVSKTQIKADGNVFHQLFRDEIHHGKDQICTVLYEKIDEENKSLRDKVIAGDPLKQYKALTFMTKVDKIEDNAYTVTWTLKYEKLNEAIPPPNAMMNFCVYVTKDIENRYLQLQPQC
ncbi:kirola-like [Apium graveolens]|uniref:kirola-like n=1 Tax=Apium graveolens TaxID=4045 RepID=UPI003D7B7B0F